MKQMNYKSFSIACIVFIFINSFAISCKKEKKIEIVEPTVNLTIDSIVATKTNIVVWEKIKITAYTKGQNLKYLWQADHGSMVGKDSSTVTYWGCYSCTGANTVKCTVSDDYGSVMDTIKITVK